VGSVSMCRTPISNGYSWGIEYLSSPGNQPPLNVTYTGTNPNMSVITKRDGGLYINHIPGNMLRVSGSSPGVEVYIHGVPANCLESCFLPWETILTVAVSSFTPKRGSGEAGTVLTLTGFGFVSNSKNKITIGGVPCNIQQQTNTSITCLVGIGSSGVLPIAVNVSGFQNVRYIGAGPYKFDYNLRKISQIFPTESNTTGGEVLTIMGYEFQNSTTIHLGAKQCNITSLTTNMITCIIPPVSSQNACIQTYILDNIRKEGVFFLSSLSKAPAVAALLEVTYSFTGTNITIYGLSFGPLSPHSSVQMGGNFCTILEWTDSSIICRTPWLSPGFYLVTVKMGPSSEAQNHETVGKIEAVLQVSGLCPMKGSLAGGTALTIYGTGLIPDSSSYTILVGDTECNVLDASSLRVVCNTQHKYRSHLVYYSKENKTGTYSTISAHVVNGFVGNSVVWQWETEYFSVRMSPGVKAAHMQPRKWKGPGFKKHHKPLAGTLAYQFIDSGVFSYTVEYAEKLRKKLRKATMSLAVGTVIISDVTSFPRPIASSAVNCGALPSFDTCSDSAAPPSNGSLNFEYSECYTSAILSVTPSNGTYLDIITVTGVGFSDLSSESKVTVGCYPCNITHWNSTWLTCRIDPKDSMEVGISFPVHVSITTYGEALDMSSEENDTLDFTLLPLVSDITPGLGSLSGGTEIYISGSGFSTPVEQIAVTLDGQACQITAMNYTVITCLTPPVTNSCPSPCNRWSSTMEVYIGHLSAFNTGSSSYVYEARLTPCVSSVLPSSTSSVSASTILTITGTGFGSALQNVKVTVGKSPCHVLSVNSTTINCTVGYLVTGPHEISVLTCTGKALGDIWISALPSPFSISPVTGSIWGGLLLTVTGIGFDPLNTTVKIGGQLCSIQNITAAVMKCFIPPSGATQDTSVNDVEVLCNGFQYPPAVFIYSQVVTPSANLSTPSSGGLGTILTIYGIGFGSDPQDILVSLDGVECMVLSLDDDVVTCALGAHAGGTFQIELRSVSKGFIQSNLTFTYQHEISSVSPNKGGHGGGEILTVAGLGFHPKASTVNICNKECLLQSSSNTDTLYCKVPASDNKSEASVICSVQVQTNNAVAMLPNSYMYEMALTPVISDVIPKRGATAGGTAIIILGSSFSTDIGSVSVFLGGANCPAYKANNTAIECITEPHSPTGFVEVQVLVKRKGLAIANETVQFFFIDLWSSSYTWEGEDPPEEEADVLINPGQTILLDKSTPVLNILIIDGGHLIFDDADLELSARYIFIMGGGILQVGTENNPFSCNHTATISLYGDTTSEYLSYYGAKFIALENGVLDLHGCPVDITWTKLAQTAEPGSNTIILQNCVTWVPGDVIVIATSGHSLSQDESELKTIKSVSFDGCALNLTQPLKYRHLGLSVELPDGTLFAARSEVGLLTRNIVVRGVKYSKQTNEEPANTSWTDLFETPECTLDENIVTSKNASYQFGGYIVVQPDAQLNETAATRLEYVEVLVYVGQDNEKQHYALQWNNTDDMKNQSYIKGCTIHQSFFIGLSLENTQGLTVENNIMYDIMGSAIYFADFQVYNNVFQNNLIIFVHPSNTTDYTSSEQSAFVIINPKNLILNNTITGGAGSGFIFNLSAMDSTRANVTVHCHSRYTLQEFKNNTVHSQTGFGLYVANYTPMMNGSCSDDPSFPVKFHSLTSWHNKAGAVLEEAGAVEFHDFIVVSNEESGLEIKTLNMHYLQNGTDRAMASVNNAAIVAHLRELRADPNFCMSRGILLPNNEGLTLARLSLVNFNQQACAALEVPYQARGWKVNFKGISFHNTTNKVLFKQEHDMLLHDEDGSLTGK
uniref:G8 domain-containing protein n=1 Tax=Latimeria chalumnae TaxID=7897 RepID=H3AM42_LATCH